MFSSRLIYLSCIPTVSLALLAAFSVSPGAQTSKATSKPPAGEAVYKQQCAACHGAKGEGSKQYSKALAGSRTSTELAAFISKSMPPGPKKCPVGDSKLVAAYIYDAFYSPVAQARNKPAHVALSRLTVRQYRNAVADLIGSFRGPTNLNDSRGLHAEYFKTARLRNTDRVVERIDPEVKFDYGTTGPTPGQADPYQFAMKWDGSIIAPDTGEYEFVVRTEHAIQLWVNDFKQPLIDALVKSGNDNEYRATLFLIAGRAYPLRLDFSKGVTGVDNLEKVKQKPPTKASISLLWRRPKQSLEVIPQRCLAPITVAQAYVPSTPFPPDDRSIGYERGTSVSKAWDDATTNDAIDTASYVVARLREFTGAADNAPDREVKLKAFCKQFVERAFRRPITPELEQFYVTKRFQNTPDLETAVKRVVLLTLKSPRFLYHETGIIPQDAYEVASNLSFGLWDSIPDKELLKAAATGQLSTREQIMKQAERMAADPRAWVKLREFLFLWLKLDQSPDLAKDVKRFPGFDQETASDLRTSLELFLENVVWNDKSDYRELMLTDKVFLNGRLAKLYGASLPSDSGFQQISLNGDERAGVLTQPYLLASFAYTDNSSPIHRGVLIARNMLGRTLQPPPAAFAPLAADLHPKLTTRQRVALQTKPAACNGCHGMINPLGFTLERFDAIGRLRDKENDQPIDATGSYLGRTGDTAKFGGAKDLAQFLAKSPEAHAAFVEKLFHHLVKQPVLAYGPKTLPNLQGFFETHDYNIRDLMVEIMATTALKR